MTVCDWEARINTAWSRLKDSDITLSRWTWQRAETAFCGALCNTCFKGAYQWSLQSHLHCNSWSKGWSLLGYQVHNGVVGLLGCKCAAVIEKADESAGEVFGKPEPKVGSRIVVGYQFKSLEYLEENLSRVNEECEVTTRIPGALQFTPPCSKCESVYLHKSKQWCKTSACIFITPYLNKYAIEMPSVYCAC